MKRRPPATMLVLATPQQSEHLGEGCKLGSGTDPVTSGRRGCPRNLLRYIPSAGLLDFFLSSSAEYRKPPSIHADSVCVSAAACALAGDRWNHGTEIRAPGPLERMRIVRTAGEGQLEFIGTSKRARGPRGVPRRKGHDLNERGTKGRCCKNHIALDDSFRRDLFSREAATRRRSPLRGRRRPRRFRSSRSGSGQSPSSASFRPHSADDDDGRPVTGNGDRAEADLPAGFKRGARRRSLPDGSRAVQGQGPFSRGDTGFGRGGSEARLAEG